MSEKWDLKTYCDILGVSENSPQFEIHAAYKKAKQTYSTDNPEIKNSFSTEESLALNNLIEEAFAILGNHSLRSIYQRKNDIQGNEIKNSTNKEPIPSPQLSEYTIDNAFEHEIKNTKVFNGENLKKIREYKQITIKEISELTKIKSTYLTAIEQDRTDLLPAPVYTRGFLKQLAKVLALPENEVASSYMSIYKEDNVSTRI